MTLTIAHLDHMFVLTEEYQAYVATIAEKKRKIYKFLLQRSMSIDFCATTRCHEVDPTMKMPNSTTSSHFYTVLLFQWFQCYLQKKSLYNLAKPIPHVTFYYCSVGTSQILVSVGSTL